MTNSERESATARDDNEPGNRSGSGAASVRAQLDIDADRKAAAAVRQPVERAKHSVLVVGDNAATRYSMARSLRAAGFQTLEASAGMEALQLVGSASAVVLDVELPDIDGMEVCRLVRGNRATAQIPIVHVSAKHAELQDLMESSKAGADKFLTAPVTPQQLVEVVETLLSDWQERSSNSSGAQP